MNVDGQIMYRRSPSTQQSSLTNQQQPQSYETGGTSPSASASFHSDGLSEIATLYDDEGHINDLSQKFEQLRRKVDVLTENQADQDEKYKRSRQENDILLNKIHSLEDQLRDLEFTSETRAKEDERRFKEAMAKQLKIQQECEQQIQNIYQLQQDICRLQSDLIKSELSIKTLRSDKEKLELELQEKNTELQEQDSEIHKLRLTIKDLQEEETRKDNIISILNEELEDSSFNGSHRREDSSDNCGVITIPSEQLSQSPGQRRFCSSRRTSVTSGFDDELYNHANSRALKDIDGLETNLCKLKEENSQLKSVNEELQAQLLNAQLEEGRCLVQETNKSYSLADEMGDIDVHRLMKALNEQQEDNARLIKYIDEILLKIVERNPEILDKTVTQDNQAKEANENIPNEQIYGSSTTKAS